MSVSSITIRNKKKYKLILLGDQSVGKTCLIERFINDKFEQSQTPTVGIDFVVTNLSRAGQNFRLQIWDTAGQQRFKSLIPSYLRQSNCGIIVYDASKKQTFQGVNKWIQMFRQQVDENSIAIVVANKIDLKFRFPKYEQVKQKCRKMGASHFQVSAKTGKNVKQLFDQIVQLLALKQSEPILVNQILQDQKSQQNLRRISEQNIGTSFQDSPSIKLSPRKAYQTTKTLDAQKNKHKQKCC